ncbi:MAG: FAD-binding oxidoreductase [Hydrotalea sp.]|nr:FAD-binding oxidoreductase [Hydrotalea sp.]
MAENLIKELQTILGAGNVLGGAADAATPYLTDSYGRRGAATAVVFPRDVASLKSLVVYANQQKYQLVPMGGNTGRSQGALVDSPDDVSNNFGAAHRAVIVVCMKHFNKIMVDEKNNSLMAESGVVLDNIHQAAGKIGRVFPVALGSAGSCQIGGVLSTNAGGYNVFRYGMARQHLLGLSVMLANGAVLSQMTATRKDNSGYDLKQLFLAAEGTLGFILAANLALVPRAPRRVVGLLPCRDVAGAVDVYHRYQHIFGPLLTGFELIPDVGRALLVARGKKIPSFFADKKNQAPFYLLFEIDNFFDHNNDAIITDMLARDMAADNIIAIAHNENEARALWAVREEIVWSLNATTANENNAGNKKPPPVARHDIALPLSGWAGGGAAAINDAVEKIVAGAIPFVFGHVGDGNLHYHFLCPKNMAAADWVKSIPAIHDAVYDAVVGMGGSFSAEHGIGREKVAAWRRYQSPLVQGISRDIKNLLDPNNIMNPGVIFDGGE